MKKKLAFMFLFLLIIPVFVLTGCSESPATYSVFAFESSYRGSTSGSGTYTDGTTVTLTASAKSDSYVVGWVYQNSLIITNGGTYTITNTVENDKVVKSTLSFRCSSFTRGNYTALFDETNINYTRLSGIMLSTQENATPVDVLPQDATTLPHVNLDISQGANLENVFSQENIVFQEQDSSALKIATNDIKNALWLNPNGTQQIYVRMTFNNANYNLRTTLSYLQNDANWSEPSNSGVSSKVNYKDKTYQICFHFTNASHDYYLTLFYENLR